MNLGETKQFDVVSIEEAIQWPKEFSEFKVEYKNGSEGWKLFDKGKTVGAKRLCRKNPVKADKIRITVKTSEKAEHKAPIISEVGVYRAAADFALGNGIPEGLGVIEDQIANLNLKEVGAMILEMHTQEEQDAGQILDREWKQPLNSREQKYGFLEQ